MLIDKKLGVGCGAVARLTSEFARVWHSVLRYGAKLVPQLALMSGRAVVHCAALMPVPAVVARSSFKMSPQKCEWILVCACV